VFCIGGDASCAVGSTHRSASGGVLLEGSGIGGKGSANTSSTIISFDCTTGNENRNKIKKQNETNNKQSKLKKKKKKENQAMKQTTRASILSSSGIGVPPFQYCAMMMASSRVWSILGR
jgi:hypothetical protein